MELRCKNRSCGAVVASSLEGRPLNIAYTETVVCSQCGADNSQRPPLLWRLAYGRRMARKQRRVYGFWWWATRRFWRCWRMPYELPGTESRSLVSVGTAGTSRERAA